MVSQNAEKFSERCIKSDQLRKYGIIDAEIPHLLRRSGVKESLLTKEEALTQFRLAASGRRASPSPTPALNTRWSASTLISHSEEDFLRRLKQGEQAAWTELVSGDYSAILYNHLRNKLPTHQDIEDVMIETFAAAVRAIQNFDAKVELSTFYFYWQTAK